ncbi:thiol peroxidase, partial [Clostridium paraputrificum]
MKKITFKGKDITLEGNQLSVGDTLKNCTLVGNDLNEVELTKTNGIRVILSVPSIDTPVCDTEVRRFNKEIESLPNVHCYTVSMDLPFAQARWCGAAGINRVT